MLRIIEERPLNANVKLSKIAPEVNLLGAHDNPWYYLQKGNLIWIEREDHYDVYELQESWDRNPETEQTFIEAIRQEAGVE